MATPIENRERLKLFAQKIGTKLPEDIQKPIISINGKDGFGNKVSIRAKQATPAVQLWEVDILNPEGTPKERVNLVMTNEKEAKKEPDGGIELEDSKLDRFKIGPGLAANIYHHGQ